MSVSWKDLDKYTQEVYVDEVCIGEIRAEFLTQKWSMYPNFWHDKSRQSLFYKKYHSAYDCGKAMANVYSETIAAQDDPWVNKYDPWGYDKD
tara:strand:+ start:721 stop:996 length:276 start_codon:yes stop_codon:yes gene_type:complete